MINRYHCILPTVQYDAQIANIEFRTSNNQLNDRSGAIFDDRSRFAIGSMGPMAAGEIISCSLYFKTTTSDESILIFYGDKWGVTVSKNLFLLTLKEGNPRLYIQTDRHLTPQADMVLNDGNWHHIIISMSSNSCLLSEVLMYVDGEQLSTKIEGEDDHIFYTTSGHLSLGGWGYSSDEFGTTEFVSMSNFEGEMDDFELWHGKVLKPTVASSNPSVAPSQSPTQHLRSPSHSPTQTFVGSIPQLTSPENFATSNTGIIVFISTGVAIVLLAIGSKYKTKR